MSDRKRVVIAGRREGKTLRMLAERNWFERECGKTVCIFTPDSKSDSVLDIRMPLSSIPIDQVDT